MAISVRKETNRVYVITMSGFVTWAESQAVQARAEAEDIFASGQVRVLIRMEELAGWEPSEQWGDVSFFFRHDADIGRIAVVGDPRWRDEMLTFLFADYRRAEVQFFFETELESARAWLIG